MKLKIRVPIISAILLMIFSIATLNVGAQSKKSLKDEHCMLILGLDNYQTLAVEVRGGKLRSFEQFPFLASPQKEGWLYLTDFRETKHVDDSTSHGQSAQCRFSEFPIITTQKNLAYRNPTLRSDTNIEEGCTTRFVRHFNVLKIEYIGGGTLSFRKSERTKTIVPILDFSIPIPQAIAESRIKDSSRVSDQIISLKHLASYTHHTPIPIQVEGLFNPTDVNKYKDQLLQKGKLGQIEGCPIETDEDFSEEDCATTLDTSKIDVSVVHYQGQWKWLLLARPHRSRYDWKTRGYASLITTPLSSQYAPYNSFKADYKKLEEKMFRQDLLVKNMFLSPGGEHLFVYTGDALYGFAYPSLRMVFKQLLRLPPGTNIVSSEWSYGPAMEKWWDALLPNKE